MPDERMWMVRAGRRASAIDDFIDEGLVAIGWGAASSLPLGASRAEVAAEVEASTPNLRTAQRANAAGQIHRFLSEVAVGDRVCSYDPGRRRYVIGEVLGEDGRRDHALGRYRKVEWSLHAGRDGLSAPTRNSLGAIQTLFLVPESAARELLERARPLEDDAALEPEPRSRDVDTATAVSTDDDGTSSDEYDDIAGKAAELIEDAIVGLDWEAAQELVAGILTAMGYRAKCSPKGADRGVDVFASPDGLGLEEPRIFVEVKHRPGSAMGAPELRGFLGGRQAGDRCLYVSTGGFTKEARYEAERSPIPLTLIALPELRELLLEYYDRLAPSIAALVPLQRLYWPAS